MFVMGQDRADISRTVQDQLGTMVLSHAHVLRVRYHYDNRNIDEIIAVTRYIGYVCIISSIQPINVFPLLV